MINFDNWKLFSKFFAKGSRDHVLGVTFLSQIRHLIEGSTYSSKYGMSIKVLV